MHHIPFGINGFNNAFDANVLLFKYLTVTEPEYRSGRHKYCVLFKCIKITKLP